MHMVRYVSKKRSQLTKFGDMAMHGRVTGGTCGAAVGDSFAA